MQQRNFEQHRDHGAKVVPRIAAGVSERVGPRRTALLSAFQLHEQLH